MLASSLRAVPLACYLPLRLAAARLRRQNMLRKISLGVLQYAHRAHKGRIAERLEEIRPLDAPEISFQAANSMVVEAVYWYGLRGYEGAVPAIWARLCASAQSVLEIGGNVGLYASVGGRAGAPRYTVVEPVPGVAALLRENIRRNQATQVEILEAAAIPDPVPRRVQLSIPMEAHEVPVGSHLVDHVEVAQRRSARLIDVDGVPFRDLIAGRDLVKIDAEGIEAELLSSARDILATTRPTLIVEVLPEAHNLAKVLVDLAQSCGYTLHALPEYGFDGIQRLELAEFTSTLPGRFNAKDVLLQPSP